MDNRAQAGAREERRLGAWSPARVDQMLHAASAIADLPGRMDFISAFFLGVPYRESTLIGSPGVDEVLVIDLAAVDCFTFLDYVESMRFSRSFDEFRDHLRIVRYRRGVVAYTARNHFFTDWAKSGRVEDVTPRIGRGAARTVIKILNRKDDGSFLLPSIPQGERKVVFIPADETDESAFGLMATGDYLGIYTGVEGLDVSHVGIVVRQDARILLRHASLKEGKVVDEELAAYVKGKPGIIVLRPLDRHPCPA
jgi:hypothetical protein